MFFFRSRATNVRMLIVHRVPFRRCLCYTTYNLLSILNKKHDDRILIFTLYTFLLSETDL